MPRQFSDSEIQKLRQTQYQINPYSNNDYINNRLYLDRNTPKNIYEYDPFNSSIGFNTIPLGNVQISSDLGEEKQSFRSKLKDYAIIASKILSSVLAGTALYSIPSVGPFLAQVPGLGNDIVNYVSNLFSGENSNVNANFEPNNKIGPYLAQNYKDYIPYDQYKLISLPKYNPLLQSENSFLGSKREFSWK